MKNNQYICYVILNNLSFIPTFTMSKKNKLQRIIEGWASVFAEKDDLPDFVKKRMAVCKNCNWLQPLGFYKMIDKLIGNKIRKAYKKVDDVEFAENVSMGCKKCGCQFMAKVSSAQESCPLKYWETGVVPKVDRRPQPLW